MNALPVRCSTAAMPVHRWAILSVLAAMQVHSQAILSVLAAMQVHRRAILSVIAAAGWDPTLERAHLPEDSRGTRSVRGVS